MARVIPLTSDDVRRMDARQALDDGWFRFTSVEGTLPSGRHFDYQLEDYPFRVNATEADIDALVCRIIQDKYRYCQWDREHPKTNQEVEIFDAIKKWMLGKIATAAQLRAEEKAPGGT